MPAHDITHLVMYKPPTLLSNKKHKLQESEISSVYFGLQTDSYTYVAVA